MQRTKRIRRGLLSWLSTASVPVFVLNERRVVLFFNRGCEELTGWTAGDLIGQSCDYAIDVGSSPRAVASRLCPPPDVFQGRGMRVPAILLHRDGASHPRTIHYFVLQESAGAALHVIGLVGPREAESDGSPAAAAARQHAELAALCDRLHRSGHPETLIGASSAAQRLRAQLAIAAASCASVHLRGRRGTGRQHFARLVHARGERRGRAFVPLDCSRIPPIELKLTLRRLLNNADQSDEEGLRPGTVYLQSAGDLPRDVQEMLVAQRANRVAIGWQLISSEERELALLVEQQRLLPEYADLLNELLVELPALTARPDDLPVIAQQCLEALNLGSVKQVGGFAPEVWEQFSRYEWPGNIAELEAVIREAHAACATPLITVRDLPFRFRTGLDAQSIGPSLKAEPVDLEALLARVETDYIRWALAAAKANKSQAAELLGLTRPRLYRRMQALGLAENDELTQ